MLNNNYHNIHRSLQKDNQPSYESMMKDYKLLKAWFQSAHYHLYLVMFGEYQIV